MEEQLKEVTREKEQVQAGGPDSSKQVVRETVSASSPPVKPMGYRKVHYFVYYILGIIEILLGFRLILKLLGANPVSGFVNFIYTVSGIFEYPFRGIFRAPSTQGFETKAVFEPSTIVAMIVYAIVAWGIARLIEIKAEGKSS